jgi:hypothetical protein
VSPASSGGGMWMGSPGLSMDFFFFFYLINRGGQPTASENTLFTVTFELRRLRYPPRLIIFTRID